MLDAACPGEVFTSPTPDQEKRDEYYKYRKRPSPARSTGSTNAGRRVTLSV
jgi:hypothetical protein